MDSFELRNSRVEAQPEWKTRRAPGASVQLTPGARTRASVVMPVSYFDGRSTASTLSGD
jgi:hypothetical protein